MRQIGRTFEIRFTLPRLATDGRRLTKPIEVDLFRALTPPNGRPQPPATSGRPWISLEGPILARYRRGPRVVYPLALSRTQFRRRLGSSFSFLAVSLTRGFRHRAFRSAPSNLAVVPILDAAGPPRELAVHTTAQALILKWAPPQATLSGGSVPPNVMYRIYASPTGKSGPFQVLGTSAVTRFEVHNFHFNEKYSFAVRTITTQDHAEAESEDSNLAEITPIDVFPPAAPRNLSGFYTAGAVELVWEASRTDMLAGYKVYRREDHRPFELLNKGLLPTPVFRDASVQPNHRYVYAVTAVGRSGNESSKSPAISIETK